MFIAAVAVASRPPAHRAAMPSSNHISCRKWSQVQMSAFRSKKSPQQYTRCTRPRDAVACSLPSLSAASWCHSLTQYVRTRPSTVTVANTAVAAATATRLTAALLPHPSQSVRCCVTPHLAPTPPRPSRAAHHRQGALCSCGSCHCICQHLHADCRRGQPHLGSTGEHMTVCHQGT